MNEEISKSSQSPTEDNEAREEFGLLASGSREGSPDADAIPKPTRPDLQQQRRQSSLAQSRPNGAPRTANRVRFDVEEQQADDTSDGDHDDANGWLEEEDYMSNGHLGGRRHSYGQRAPLLTGIEAPSVTIAEADFDPEDLLESARPKSSMRSAFVNMANSIMCGNT